MSTMENQNHINKKSFALLVTIFLVLLLAFFSLRIIENNLFLSNLNKLKYLNLQGNIHMDYIKDFINTKSKYEIDNFSLDDDRFNLELIKKDEDNKTIYYIYLNTKDKTPIRLSQTIIK